MTVAAVLMVKNEADVIEDTIKHLAEQVDEIVVADNLSTDETGGILANLYLEGLPLVLVEDREVAYMQSRKTTELAQLAGRRGHDWVVPCDADERWTATDGRTVGRYLLSLPPDVYACAASLYHYVPTALDPPETDAPSVFQRIGWRIAEPAGLPKTAGRIKAGLVVEAGNHFVTYDGKRPSLTSGGLRVDHYSWRTPEQYASKIVNGSAAYAATDLPDGVGAHWRMWGDPDAPDLAERAAAHFRAHFWAQYPPRAPGSSDPDGLVYDPAVVLP